MVPITVDITRHIRGDVAAGNHDVAVYDETLCLTRDDDNEHPQDSENNKDLDKRESAIRVAGATHGLSSASRFVK